MKSFTLLVVCIQKSVIKVYLCLPFSVPQIEYLLGGSSKKGRHVYFLLKVAMVKLL